MDNVNKFSGLDGEHIGAIVLPKQYDSFKVLSDYILGEKPVGFNNVFAKKITDLSKNAKIIKDSYSINGNGLVAVELDDSAANIPKVKRAILECLDGLVDELTGLEVHPLARKVSLDKKRLDMTYKDGEPVIVDKSPVDVTSFLMQNQFSSTPVYTTSDCNNCRVNDAYFLD